MRDKRIFISGGAGVIGTALVNQLLAEGAILLIGDLKPCPPEWEGRLQYRQGDLNTITVQELQAFKPEIFFHLAATFERSEETYPFFIENFHHNIQLSHALMNCLREVPSLKKVVFASSYLIYDPLLYQFEKTPQKIYPLKETDRLAPRNLCGAAKLFHEEELRFLENFFKAEVQFISARIFRVYGRHSRDIISRWVRAALKQETLMVYCLEGRFDYVFADDVAEGLFRLAKSSYSGVVNLGSGHSRSIADVLRVLKNHFQHLEAKEASCEILIEASQADITRLQKWTGWSPVQTLETAIPLIIAFEQQQHIPNQDAQATLITSISKKMPLIASVRLAVQKKGNGSLHGCDSNENCIGRYGVDQFWHCPPLKSLSIKEVVAYCKKYAIRSIIPTRNADLLFYAQHANLLLQADIGVMVSSLEAVQCCLDKKAFADFLIHSGFPAIPTALTLEELPVSRYVVKERYGAGSQHIGLNLAKEQIYDYLKAVEDPIFQPYIEGKEWSVDLYRDKQGQIIGVVARERNVVSQGESQVTTTAAHPRLEELCQSMAHCLNLYGHVIFQVLEDASGHFHVIECNPRFGGASTASVAVGLDSFYWFLLECAGTALSPHFFFRHPGEIRQIRYAADKVIPWSSSST